MLRITIHDNAEMLRFHLNGELTGVWVRELALCWQTASSTLRDRTLQVDLRQTTEVDSEGRDLLSRLGTAGATFVANDDKMTTLIESLTGKPAVRLSESQPFFRKLARFVPCPSNGARNKPIVLTTQPHPEE